MYSPNLLNKQFKVFNIKKKIPVVNMAGEADNNKKKGKLSQQNSNSNRPRKQSVVQIDTKSPPPPKVPSTTSTASAIVCVREHRNENRSRFGIRTYKIVVLGDGAVGKSAVTHQFVSHNFLTYHDPTIEDSYEQQAVIDGEPALLDILDTAGQANEVICNMRDQYMRSGEGFMICYSITDRHSFQELLEYKKQIQKVRVFEETPIVLIGNKVDLVKERKVTAEEGQSLALQLGCPFYETSAVHRTNVDEAFHKLVREIRIKEQIKLDGGERKLKRHSKWWRLRSIFALVFRRKRRLNSD